MGTANKITAQNAVEKTDPVKDDEKKPQTKRSLFSGSGIKILAFSVVFFLFGFGRWINLVVVHEWPASSSLQVGIDYGILVGLLAYFLVDLVLARGLLQFKILWLRTIFLWIVFISILNYYLFSRYPFHMKEITCIEAVLGIIFFIAALNTDNKKKNGEPFLFSGGNVVPAKYLRRQPLKTMLETLLRLFPYPEPVALYKIGNPSQKSPVFVTGNYDLTIRRVIAALESQDCWLLVCDSRGINTWCSSLAGHFKSEDIIKAINLTKLSEKVSHKKIILPQLCAGSVSPQQIKKETRFDSEFGPAAIENIAAYLENKKDQQIRKVTFTIMERLEMAVGCPLILTVLLIFIYNFIGLSHLLLIIPTIYVLTLIHAAVFPHRAIKGIIPWSIFIGAIVFFIIFSIFSAGMGMVSLGNCIAVSIGMIYIVNEFSGWSPLMKYNLIPYKKPHITVEQDTCTGCYRCIDVCPKGVFTFEDGKSRVGHLSECIICTACFRQCPAGAIIHSHNA